MKENTTMTIVGIDPSINNTGVCINHDFQPDRYIYILVSNHVTKKASKMNIDNVYTYLYNKEQCDDKLPYSVRENVKTRNLYNIVNNIEKILLTVKPDKVVMEAPSFGSFMKTRSLCDLVGLNYLIRNKCNELNIPVELLSPNELKKEAVGNGTAKKDVMVMTWKGLQPKAAEAEEYIKVDDLSDAFHLSNHITQ